MRRRRQRVDDIGGVTLEALAAHAEGPRVGGHQGRVRASQELPEPRGHGRRRELGDLSLHSLDRDGERFEPGGDAEGVDGRDLTGPDAHLVRQPFGARGSRLLVHDPARAGRP